MVLWGMLGHVIFGTAPFLLPAAAGIQQDFGVFCLNVRNGWSDFDAVFARRIVLKLRIFW